MIQKIHRHAFTMIELIMVLVVLGIVASIGSSMIAQTYESYIMQKAIHNANFKTELAVNSIANRLAYRINVSMVARKPGQTGNTIGTDIYDLISIPPSMQKIFTILEWINYENDGFKTANPPGWSAFADLNASSFTSIQSTGSALDTENTILGNLQITNNPAIMFLSSSGIYRNDTNASYTASCMYQAGGCMFPVSLGGTTLTFQGGDRALGQMQYSEFYQLAASAYAVVPVVDTSIGGSINGIPVWDLYLYSNYQPWAGENYTNARNKSLLAKNVSVFRFKQEPSSARIKICSIEQIGDGTQISICKEKAVIR